VFHWISAYFGFPSEALLCEQEGNQVREFFLREHAKNQIVASFALHKLEGFHFVVEAFNDVSGWIENGLREVLNSDQFRHTITGTLGDALQRRPD
jgi:hypothetical protein